MMRLLNRLNQFQRLWAPSQGEPQSVTVAELAERCFCSERHIRTLLTKLAEQNWLRWQSHAGRGKRGTLTFLVSPQQVRATMMETVLDKGQHQNALELAQLAPEQLRQALQPFLGGQWQNDVPTVRIPYYRPLEALTPGFLAGRAEQHLASQIFSGLTRFVDGSPLPQPDMAHHWRLTQGGRCQEFWLRPSLFWHNGEKVSAEHLKICLTQLLTLPELGQLFSSVSHIEAPSPGLLRFHLHHADYWLTHRLASYCSHLSFPGEPMTGCGPFKITQFAPELVRLEVHDRYHLAHPLIGAVEYWITPALFDPQMGTSCRHPVQIAIGEQQELTSLQPIGNQVSLGFCYLAIKQGGKLSRDQASWLTSLIHHSGLLNSLPVDDGLIQASHALLPGWPLPDNADLPPVDLPPVLTLLYHLPVELHAMARQLAAHLAGYGCELRLRFHDAKTWQGYEGIADGDLVMGDRLIDEAAEYTLEQWLRSDPLWPAILPGQRYPQLIAALDAIQCQSDYGQRLSSLRALFSQLMGDGVLTPLFNYNYQIHAPPNVKGVKLNARGWFDFCQLWLPPPGSA